MDSLIRFIFIKTLKQEKLIMRQKILKLRGKLMTLNLKWRKIRDDIGI